MGQTMPCAWLYLFIVLSFIYLITSTPHTGLELTTLRVSHTLFQLGQPGRRWLPFKHSTECTASAQRMLPMWTPLCPRWFVKRPLPSWVLEPKPAMKPIIRYVAGRMVPGETLWASLRSYSYEPVYVMGWAPLHWAVLSFTHLLTASTF